MEQLGHNDNEQVRSLRHFLIPSVYESLLYILITITVMILANARLIWSLMSDYSGINPVEASEVLDGQLAVFNNELLGKATVFIVWGVIGCIAYVLVWAIQHFYSRVHNDAEESGYDQNRRISSKYWESKISQHILLVACIVIFGVTIAASLFVIPLLTLMTKITMQNLSDPSAYTYLFTALLGGYIYLYLVTRVFRITKYVVSTFFQGTDE